MQLPVTGRGGFLAVFLALALAVSLVACEAGPDTLRMHVPLHRQFDPLSIQSIFEERSGLRLVPAPGAAGLPALEVLSSDLADLTLLENSTAFVTGVRAVLPVYQSVLHVMVRDDFEPSRPDQPLRGASIHVLAQSAAGETFVDLITRRQGLDPGDFRKSETVEPGITDVIFYFGPIEPDRTHWFLPGYRLISPGVLLGAKELSSGEHVAHVAYNMKVKEIPAYTYDLPGNERAIPTAAVDTLLVTKKRMPAATIYELTRTLLEQKPRFTAVAPALFAGINESFDPLDLNFPLHAGARRYLERDEPSLLERYAESINMLVYVTFLALTGFLALARWRAQRKKDRVDVFYERVLAIRDRVGEESGELLLGELAAIEREAFSSLIDERLAADESFRIFTDLLEQARADIRRS